MAGMVLGRTIIEYGRNPPLIIDSCGIPCPVCETREYYRTELSLLKQMGVAPLSLLPKGFVLPVQRRAQCKLHDSSKASSL